MKKSEVIIRLLNIDVNDYNGILKLLVEAYDYNDELVEQGFYKELYKRLKDTYKPLTEDNKTLKLYRNIKDGRALLTVDNYGLIMIEELMIFIKGNKGVDPAVVGRLFNYHNKVNRKFIKDYYTEKMKANIGKDVRAILKKRDIICGVLNYSEEDGWTINGEKVVKADKIISAKKGKSVYFLYTNNILGIDSKGMNKLAS